MSKRLLALFILLLIPITSQIVFAQTQATTITASNLHAGPSKAYGTVGSLLAGSTVFAEAKNDGNDWLLVHSTDDKRGWLLARQVQLAASLDDIPVSDEIVGPSSEAATPVPAQLPGPTTPSDTLVGSLRNPAAYSAQMTPAVTTTIKRIFAQGRDLGENPNVFSRVGDCLSQGEWFFHEYGAGGYSLGRFGYLQSVINHYSVPTRDGAGNSFTVVSQAALGGFTTYRVLDSTWTDPNLCKDISPLVCEYELNKPSVALINLGLVDTQSGNSLARYTSDLQLIVDTTIQYGIIPILVEPAQTPEHLDRARAIANIVISTANRRGLPLIRLGDALARYPHNGLDYDGIHLTPNLAFSHADFNNMKYGFDVWNYLALQSLYNVLQVLGQ